jgi:hypothetical protein
MAVPVFIRTSRSRRIIAAALAALSFAVSGLVSGLAFGRDVERQPPVVSAPATVPASAPLRTLWLESGVDWAEPVDPITGRSAPAWRPQSGDLVTGAVAPASERSPETGIERLRHLPNNIQGYRLVGEIGSSEWPLFLTEAQSRGRLRFRVGYLASISVMPEASVLTVWINDRVIGRTRIFAPTGVRTSEFDVPPGLLQYGFNSVRITVEQRHRVDCSLGATYELWTQIDASRTGLVLSPQDPGVSDLRDLAAVPADTRGIVPIRAVIQERTGLGNIENIVRAVQAIALAGRFEQPVVDFGPVETGQFGINLAIGTVDELSEQFDPARLGTISGPRVMVLPATASDRTAVIVTGVSAKDVQDALTQLLIEKEQIGSTAGLRAASNFPGYAVQDGQRVRMRDFGLVSTEFSGRFFRASFNIMMPPDFYSADYAKMFLNLDGGYASGLLNDAQIMVNINDRNAASLKLPNSAGEVFRGNELPLPLGLLRPGLNRIEIQAEVPMASDASCDPLAAIEGKKRFLFLDTTELVFPSIARIARMPDLAVTATGAFPFAGNGKRPKLFVPTPNKESMGAATTLAARLAISAGRMIDFQVTVTEPPAGSGPTLAVSPARSFTAEQITAAGLDPEAVRAAWGARSEAGPRRDPVLNDIEAAARRRIALQRNFPAACSMRYVPPVTPARVAAGPQQPPATTPAPRGAPSGEGGLFDQWKQETGGGWFGATISGVIATVRRWSSATVGGVTGWIQSWGASPEEIPGISAQSSLIISQDIRGSSVDDVWTYVIAPNAEVLGESIACLVDPRVWRQVEGRVAFLDASEGKVTRITADRTSFIQTQPLSARNIRLIAASWLSLNESAYVVLAVIVSLILSISTMTLLRNVGRSSS